MTETETGPAVEKPVWRLRVSLHQSRESAAPLWRAAPPRGRVWGLLPWQSCESTSRPAQIGAALWPAPSEEGPG